ncbi:uncharacterized protein LOC131434603 isoform X3 [Malaya genurostris]|uniref:uncharacterized protein LOC131434603 isoform X3 n=1 Tax=Malaya genurostris TaxID=325434 RepID=UPI0026F3CC4B|nr:uncharacterized protein LOC131434603 isoform X3 [Malaya genurostris]
MIRLSLTSSVFILFAQIIFRKHFVSSGFESFYYKSDNESYRAPKHEALLRSPTADRTLPVFPDNSNTVYFIIALHGGGKLWSSMLARTLLDMGTPFTNPLGPPLKPIILDLPSNGRYTSKILTTLCDLIDSVPLAGMIVVGEGQASKMVALAGSSMKIPVLWAKGGVASFQGTANELMSKSQAILQPSSREIFAALQSILLKTGWYSFYILSDIKTTMLLEGNEGYGLKMKPLHATIIQLPTNSDLIKRQLARISQSTRGVVILFCELHVARRILSEAKRMRMLNGHFIWLWTDTNTANEFYDSVQIPFGLFSSDTEEDEFLRMNNPLHSVKEDIENDFYGATDIIQQSHIADLVERKMDFEIFDVKYKKNRTTVENENRSYSIAKSDKVNLDFNNIVLTSRSDDSFTRNVDSRHNIYNDNLNVSTSNNYSTNEDPETLRIKNVAIEDGRYFNKVRDTTYRTPTFKDNKYKQKKNVHINSSKQVNFHDSKTKRSHHVLKYINISSHVLFHNFQDLPVGLLALRPVVMKLDRHFVRSAVRLFASTWVKIEQERDTLKSSSLLDKPIYSESKYSFHKHYKRSVSNCADQTYTKENINNNIRQNMGVNINSEINNETITYSIPNKSKSNVTKKKQMEMAGNTSYSIPGGKIQLNSSQSNTRNKFVIPTISLKQKRQKTWWSTKTYESRDLSGDRIRSKGGSLRYSNGCYGTVSRSEMKKAELFIRYLHEGATIGLAGQSILGHPAEKSLIANFEILNLVPVMKHATPQNEIQREAPGYRADYINISKWRRVGFVSGRNVHLDTIVWPNGDIVVTAQSGRSLKRGLKLSQILDVVSETMDTNEQPKPLQTHPKHQWNGIVGELVSGSADMSFAPLSVSKERAKVIDFSVPFFHGSVSLLAAPQSSPDVPLLAFLLPFSHELWIAIFTSLNITAVAVAIYEWLSPFGLNPWGRQRSKNFSMSSALWVMWGLLCGHLVAFKAPKSWPNKFLINVWGGFSVIFIASYTANIAALIAGLLFHNESGGYSGPLLKQRIGVPLATAAEYYVQTNDKILWEHMKRYQLLNIENGIERLKNGTIDLLMADSPILDYYRATDLGCTLQRVGDTYVDDSYAIGMNKGFPLKETISALISKYSSDGTLDILTEKWYGSLACFKLDRDIGQPKPLGVRAVAGVFLLLGFGMILGLLILVFEHVFYKYALPVLRHQPKNTVWKSRNIMFFSQKLYRFINYVELVSPHHSAKELVHTIRQGQITSLFQKSIKRKEDEQRRRRKSKAKFYDMIQEIRSTRFTLDYLLDKQTMDV